MKVAAISGYKPFELGIFEQNNPAVAYIKTAIKKQLYPLVEAGLEWVIISGQLGVELWAAEAVYELQLDFPELKLGVITPFLNQEAKWNEKNKEWYESVVSQADFVDSITKKNYENQWQFRLKNQFFVEKSELLLLLYDHEKEGSPKFLYETALSYREKHSYEIRLITFYDLQLVVEQEEEEKRQF